MKNNQDNNGMAGADNPSEKEIREFLRDTLISNSVAGYKIAINDLLGCDELVGPVTRFTLDNEYTFDLHHPDCGRLYKIFQAQDLSEYEKYLNYPGELVILVNVQSSDWDRSLLEPGNPLLILPGENEKRLKPASTLLYSYGVLWEVDYQREDGTLVWHPLKPVECEVCVG